MPCINIVKRGLRNSRSMIYSCSPMGAPIITLTTDFGNVDHYVAAMKGVILGITPAARIVDVTHDIPPQDLRRCAAVLAAAGPWFPPGTVHVAVVDPGVGGGRAALAGRFGEQIFVFPDNGLITMIAERQPCAALVSLETAAGGKTVSPTFHGRDIFAPAAARLAAGAALHDVGVRAEGFETLDAIRPRADGNALVGEITLVDRFGNLVSCISRADVLEHFSGPADLNVICGDRAVGGIRETYCNAEPGQPLALFNADDYLEIAVNCGSAADVLGRGAGTKVTVKKGNTA